MIKMIKISPLLFLLLGSVFPEQGNAELSKMVCRTTPGPAATGTVCLNETGENIPVQVTFRKMPSWGGQASFLLVDMCEMVGEDEKPENLVPGACIRRYCSEDLRTMGFSLNGVPLPLGIFSLNFWLGVENSHFELRCENVF